MGYTGKQPAVTALTGADIAPGSIEVSDLSSTLNLSSKTVTLPANSVTAHVTEYNDANIRSDILKLALHQAVDGNRVAYNLENSFIDGFEDDTGITTETTVDRDATGEYVASIYDSTTVTTPGSGDWTGDTGSYAITSGGVDNTAGDDSIKSNWTSGTGDFTIQFTATGVVGQTWGFYPVTEDGTFASNDSGGMTSMSGSYWFTGNSTNVNKMQYGSYSTSRAISSDIVAGDVVKYTRISGEVKVYVNSSLVYTYPETSNADMRVNFANHGPPYTGDIDSLTFSVTSTITNATGTLISDAQTASSSRTSCSGVIIYSDASGTATLGTDLKIYFTCNNGTNWTEASSYGTATTYSGTKKLVKLGATTCTAGTQVAMKAVWANQASGSKETRLEGWAVNF